MLVGLHHQNEIALFWRLRDIHGKLIHEGRRWPRHHLLLVADLVQRRVHALVRRAVTRGAHDRISHSDGRTNRLTQLVQGTNLHSQLLLRGQVCVGQHEQHKAARRRGFLVLLVLYANALLGILGSLVVVDVAMG